MHYLRKGSNSKDTRDIQTTERRFFRARRNQSFKLLVEYVVKENGAFSAVRHECRSQHLLGYHIVDGIIMTPMNSRRGWQSQKLVEGPRACARGENVSRPISNEVNSQAFPVGRKQMAPFFWTSCFQVLQGMFVPGTKFRASIRRTDCVGPILSQIFRPKSNID